MKAIFDSSLFPRLSFTMYLIPIKQTCSVKDLLYAKELDHFLVEQDSQSKVDKIAPSYHLGLLMVPAIQKNS